MVDVVIVGAGPAGCVAAITLARQGVRVLMLDRARFPRSKLCGDSLNPGALHLLGRLGLSTSFPESRSVAAEGMIVTGEAGVRIHAPYPASVRGRFIARSDLDSWLLDEAIAAGAEYRGSTRVTGAVVSPGLQGNEIRGVRVSRSGRDQQIPAPITIAADGRRSVLAFGLGLATHPARHRSWAVGGYFSGVAGLSSFGEMHIRAGRYFGIAPLPDGLANVSLVAPALTGLRRHRDLGAMLGEEIARDPVLAPRLESARLVTRAAALGPLAVDAHAAGMPGLLLAGDAAGFIDPLTGDGMYFAMRGGEMAGQAALLALSGRTASPHVWLHAKRHTEFRFKAGFDRTLRLLASHPSAVTICSHVARIFPASIQRIATTCADIGPREETQATGRRAVAPPLLVRAPLQ